MKILAIDTSSKICSVSILEDNKLILEKHNNDEKTHSQKLMPLIDELLKECNIKLEDINLYACSVGPGSFTGLRIGISTVKAFSDATNIQTCGISSLESLAYNISEKGLIASIIDAKNENVYFSLFLHSENGYKKIEDFCADNIYNVIDKLLKYADCEIICVGDGSLIYKNILSEKIKNIKFADEEKNDQTSVSIGKAAYDKFLKGIHGNSNSLIPMYLRKSQAERALERTKIIIKYNISN